MTAETFLDAVAVLGVMAAAAATAAASGEAIIGYSGGMSGGTNVLSSTRGRYHLVCSQWW